MTRTRLPYPHGDYASPSDPALSPTGSPSAITPTHRLSTSISGLPNVSGQSSSPSLTSGLPNAANAASPTPTSSSTAPIRATSPLGGLSSLPPPKSVAPGLRGGSTSPTPTPRKRYTVALGGPIVAPPEVEAEYERERERAALGMAFFSSSPSGAESDDDEYTMYERSGEDDDGASRASHVAAASARLTRGFESTTGTDDSASVPSITSLSPNARVRAQSSYGAPQGYSNMFQSNQNLNSNETSSRHRLRSQSTDFRYGPGLSSNTLDGTPSTPSTAKFVDPLVLRRQEKSERGRGKEKEIKALVGPGKKVPVGKLVAFFDSERT
ncbi:hypothetical protein SERLA73DRAFT_179389 [Serpula lacrymans var. lacrymans S7.3]|uniref:Uncharacterized protein n=1 Tax=Serpula lacrymans var. lacrymans (strain S7.3) TaxID=936435 RepID=F8PS73_SERL3|nr:hypothetical protein SERLA73DRAFT_179389 [Serpula lacrymans var. lacrymans S7.3]